MSGGKEKKQTNQMIQQQQAQEQAAYQAGNTRNQGDLGKYGGRNDRAYDDLYGAYSSLAGIGGGGQAGGPGGGNTGGFVGTPGGGGGGGGGGPAPGKDPRLQGLEDFYKKLTGEGGGWDPERLKSLEGDISNIRGMASDPEIARRMRGNGVFEEFSNTGGYSAADQANIRARGNAQVPAMFGRMRDEANRASVVQGGYGPGKAALMSRMGREQARSASDAALGTELGLSENIRRGRMEAAGAMSGAENQYQSLRGMSLRDAANMTQGLETDIYGRNTKGFEGLGGMAEREQAAAAAAAASAAAGDRWKQQFDFQKQMAGLGGMQSLYGAGEGAYGRGLEYDLGNRGLNQNAQQGNTDQYMRNNPQKSWTDYAGAAAGVASLFI